jgi:hypothetical protein
MGYEPPPPPPSYPGGGGAGARPGILTGAAIVLFVLGALVLLSSLVLFALGGLAAFLYLVAILYLAGAAAAVYAGVQVLQLRQTGRMIGMVIAGILGVLALLSITKAPVFSIIIIGAAGFVIYALSQNEEYFHP